MKEKIKNHRGFIQIPILIAIIVSILVLGGGGYFGIKQYQNNQVEKIEQEKIAQEKENEMQAKTDAQQKALKGAQQEIDNLKIESEQLKIQQKELEQRINQETLKSKDTTITIQQTPSPTLNVKKLLNTIVMVICPIEAGQYSQGSGTIVYSGGTILTNAHVVDPNYAYNSRIGENCSIGITVDPSKPPNIKYIARIQSVLHTDDIALLRITTTTDGSSLPNTFDYLNYPECSTTKTPQLNDKVYIIGYPAIGSDTFTITDGIISGSVQPWHFKTSAKIDKGNSGGAAVNENSQLIGIPTYGVRGALESMGYIINLLGGAATCN